MTLFWEENAPMRLGFFCEPMDSIEQPVLPIGSSVDDVIRVLQAYGLVRQA